MRSRRTSAVLLVVLLLASAAVAGVGSVAAQEDEDDGLSTADEAYVEDDGDVVLVYRNESEDTRANFGVSVSRSVFHALVVTNTSTETNLTGTATAVFEPNRIAGNGSLQAHRPRALESLQLDVTSARTDENAKLDASLQTTLKNVGTSAFVESADASGQLSVTPSTFSADGQFSTQLRSQLGRPQHHAFSLRETSDGYVLTGEQNYTVSSYSARQWSTRSRAEQTLQAQYSSVARSLGGDASITVQSYSYTNTSAGGRLDVAFRVRYTGVDEGLQRQVAASLASSEDVDLTRQEATAVGEGLAELQIEDVSVTFDQRPRSIEGSFAATLSNYEPAVRGTFTVLRSLEAEGESEFGANFAAQVEALQKRFEARQAANLKETYSFDASLRTPSRGTTTVSASLKYRTENWGAYVQALEERGIDPTSVSLELHAQTEGEQITATGSVEVEKEKLLQEATDQLLNTSNDTLTAEQKRFVRAFEDSEFRKARMDVRINRDTVEIEAGAAFQNLTAFRDALAETSGGTDLNVASVVGRTNEGSVETYVLAKAAVSPDANESAVRALEPVAEDTTVHMPGTYNRTFPEMDVKRAYDYLGLEAPATPTPTPGDGGIVQPGFGVGVAALALLAVALLTARRRSL